MKFSRGLLALIAGLSTIAIPLTYNACSKGFEVSDLASQVGVASIEPPVHETPVIEVPPCSGGNCEPEALPNSSVSPFKDSLMTADQVLRSLGALTQITLSPANETAILAQYSTRLSSLPSDYNPSAMSAPSIISVTSLAGEFCELGLTQDSTLTSSLRKLLPSNLNLRQVQYLNRILLNRVRSLQIDSGDVLFPTARPPQ